MNHMIIKIKDDRDYDMLINMDNVCHVKARWEGGYVITFVDGTELELSWKGYDRLNKAMEVISE